MPEPAAGPAELLPDLPEARSANRARLPEPRHRGLRSPHHTKPNRVQPRTRALPQHAVFPPGQLARQALEIIRTQTDPFEQCLDAFPQFVAVNIEIEL